MGLADRYQRIRANTVAAIKSLSDSDATVQSMPDASPAKWHLAHTSWFFEEFLLAPRFGDAIRFDPAYAYLFNSYYDAVGARHQRDRRGMLTRPSLDEVLAYRAHVDCHMQDLLATDDFDASLVALGFAHEEQHQELLYTDILHLFAQNPLKPALCQDLPADDADKAAPLSWHSFAGGIVSIGHQGKSFAFDCEGPRHDALVPDFRIANRAVTNAEWIAFMADGGYRDPRLWLADGYALRQEEDWQAPLYWERRDNEWWQMTLFGLQPVRLEAPVTHISFYEADAYAAWVGARLPTEFEWEYAAQTGSAPPSRAPALLPRIQSGDGLLGLFDDVWEWTASAYRPYPGFTASADAVGEYNGKFMSGQMVLRGGSCVTSQDHQRASYRNFFHPGKRWQFSGLRLAKDSD
ncbi:MAG: ergothioneine biosynthesis protein EgtB [Rhizobiales bacterium]|nr:ergothioneine biosynthesis protein EgtB [Hyphomicrobiales bacterium]